ncbi:MAG: CPBP family intramembrane glutamic endopeptidase [Chitinophagaceae bacterium]
MKKIFFRFPLLSRFVLAITLGMLALIASGLITTPFLKNYFPFIDVILLTIVTWIMYKIDNQSLRAIGLNITFRHIGFLILGTLIGIIAFGVVTYLRTLYTGEIWHINDHIMYKELLKALYFILPSVVVQELMFRGYFFTKTISAIGVVRANIVFSILFMLVHVIDRDLLQQPLPQIIFLAVAVTIGHLMFAASLLRSKTLFFPIGIHWGNNWAVSHLLSYKSNDHAIFQLTNQKVFNDWPSFIILFLIFNGFFLLLTWIIWKKNKNLSLSS